MVQESKSFQIETIKKNYCEIIAMDVQITQFFCSEISNIILGQTNPPIVIDMQ